MSRNHGWARPAPVLLCVAVAMALGCGSAPGPTEHLDPLFDTKEAGAAARLAPDLFADAERARKLSRQAREGGDPMAAADYATEARLLLTAATVEAQRIELEQRRLAVEERERQTIEQVVHSDRRRRDVEQRTRRLLAAQIATEQARKAFEAAEAVETRRGRLREAEGERTHAQAARALIARTELLLSAARALGAGEEALASAGRALERARETRDTTRRLAAADEALRVARAVLGAARANREGPSEEELASFIEEATTAGLEVRRLERGLALRVEPFRGAGVHPSRRQVRDLASFLRGHPHGPVSIEVSSAGGRPADRRSEARGRALLAALARAGVTADRLTSQVVPGDGKTVDLVLPAYGR